MDEAGKLLVLRTEMLLWGNELGSLCSLSHVWANEFFILVAMHSLTAVFTVMGGKKGVPIQTSNYF